MIPPRESLLRLLKDPPRPWHLLLTPAIPLLGLLKDSLWITPPTVIIAPLTTAIAVALILALFLLPLGADRHRSAVAVSLLVLAALSYVMLAAPINAIAPRAVVYIGYGMVALVVLKLLGTRGSAPALTSTANRVVAIAVLLLALPMVWSEWRRPITRADPLVIPAVVSTRPDVYVIVLDGYARHDVLREVFGFENSLVTDLRANDFFIADRARANYSQTALSLASALNADYIPTLNPAVRYPMDRRGLGDLINDSRFFRAFASAGYRIRAYSSEYALIQPRAAHDRPSPALRLNDFSSTAYETTILPTMLNALGLPRGGFPMRLHRHHINWTFDHLAQNGPDESQPALVFAHILAPHPPFAFDGNGGARPTRMPSLIGDGDMWHRMASSTGESYKSGYLDTVRTLNARLTTALRSITARRRESIVLIHSDHGPGSGFNWERPDQTDVRERMSILAALRFPDGDAPPLGPDATLVNVYRSVLNRALGTALPTIEDRSYYSAWKRPYDFVDVTDQLSATAARGLTAAR